MPIKDSDVKAVLQTQRDTSFHIASAELVVSEILSGAGLTQARLDLITTYLAAHFCAITDYAELVSSKVGDTSETYTPISSFRKPLDGFRMTKWGQQALALDTSGTLAAVTANAGIKALFTLIGQKQDPDWTGDQTPV